MSSPRVSSPCCNTCSDVLHLPQTRPKVREMLGLKTQQKRIGDAGISSATREGTLFSGPFLLCSSGGTTWMVQPFEQLSQQLSSLAKSLKKLLLTLICSASDLSCPNKAEKIGVSHGFKASLKN